MILTWNLDQQLNLTRETKQRQKNLTMASCQQVVMSLSFIKFLDNLEQSGSRISDAYSVKLIFSLKVTFYLTKTGSRTKKSLAQLSIIALNKSTIFAKIAIFLQKMLTLAKLIGPCSKRYISCNYICVCQIWPKCQIWSF